MSFFGFKGCPAAKAGQAASHLLLAEVYVELTGGRQRGLSLAAQDGRGPVTVYVHTGPRTPHPIVPTEAELAAHAAFLTRIKEPVWLLP